MSGFASPGGITLAPAGYLYKQIYDGRQTPWGHKDFGRKEMFSKPSANVSTRSL